MSLNADSKPKGNLTITSNYVHVEILSKRVSKTKFKSTAEEVFGNVYFKMLLMPIIVDSMYSKIDGIKNFSWDLYKLSNGGVFLAPQTNELLLVKSEKGLHKMPAEAVGVALTMCVYEQIGNSTTSNINDICVEQYWKLDQFYRQHPYQLEIYNFFND